MSIEIQCMTEKLKVITIKLDYSKVPSKSTVPTYALLFSYNLAQLILGLSLKQLRLFTCYCFFSIQTTNVVVLIKDKYHISVTEFQLRSLKIC